VTAAKYKPVRVDHYWREMLSITTVVGEPKYPFLSVLVKTALALPHSNVDVERSLSVNNRMVYNVCIVHDMGLLRLGKDLMRCVANASLVRKHAMHAYGCIDYVYSRVGSSCIASIA